MTELLLVLGWVGLFAPVALGAIGSSIGCARAGSAAIGAMLDTESGYGRFIGVSLMPSSQVIYGIVIMFSLQRDPMTAEAATAIFGIGLLAGIALLYIGLRQGDVLASAISASKAKPEIFGISLAPAAVLEGFAVFALVFALVLSGTIPG
ncbi:MULTISPECIES: ATP synthase subunit C [Stappia]|uniref:ATP synthase subunit C n=1 Tax=Stappia taiwanensis TaxID=992267 RepID=A0A838XHK6_9HYPH|nr:MULTISPECIES: ATP synthase subunit C [Stappia]MBA4610075.1 ATP synthase subunit C [Stappia taiwanensis]MCA1297360.1 ATP synthase subunit C [Stappia indica]GGE76731.1 V-type ATP synthase subunit K [Stappia taiwanensis]